jgi:hypothetical protein
MARFSKVTQIKFLHEPFPRYISDNITLIFIWLQVIYNIHIIHVLYQKTYISYVYTNWNSVPLSGPL